MVFIELNDGRRENLLHITEINVDGSDVVYKPARGSFDGHREHFETAAEAEARYEGLKTDLLAKVDEN